MQAYAIVAFEYSVMLAAAAFAYHQGRRAEQLGALWFGVNVAASILTTLCGLDSPLTHLIVDGVFAIGLLPLAMIFVSYWIGLVTLISAALFSLEAIYLLNDWPTDHTYAWFNNSLLLLTPIVFISCGAANLFRNRRAWRERDVQSGGAVGC